MDPSALAWGNQQTRQYYGKQLPFEASQYMDCEPACFPDIPYFRSKLNESFWINVWWFDPLGKRAS